MMVLNFNSAHVERVKRSPLHANRVLLVLNLILTGRIMPSEAREWLLREECVVWVECSAR